MEADPRLSARRRTVPFLLPFVLIPLYCVEFILIGVQVLWYRKVMPDPVYSQFDWNSQGTKQVPKNTYLLVYLVLHLILLSFNLMAFQLRSRLVLRSPNGSFFFQSTIANERAAMKIAGECVIGDALAIHLLFALYYELAFEWNVRPHKAMPVTWLILLAMLASIMVTYLALRGRLKAAADPEELAAWAHAVGHEVYVPEGSFVLTDAHEQPGGALTHAPGSETPIARFGTRDGIRPVVVMVSQPGEGLQMGTSVVARGGTPIAEEGGNTHPSSTSNEPPDGNQGNRDGNQGNHNGNQGDHDGNQGDQDNHARNEVSERQVDLVI